MTQVQALPQRKQKSGLCTRIYSRQLENSIKRGHSKPTYSRKEFKEWLYSQPKFHVLYDNWNRLDFQRGYSPSVDRKDDDIGYTMDNIQLMTWKENANKHSSDMKIGKNNHSNKAVVQMDLDGNLIAEFHSTQEASRQTGFGRVQISNCCNGKQEITNGYKFAFKKDMK